jgi:EmrB/QacA subfamily drug resistance transporter
MTATVGQQPGSLSHRQILVILSGLMLGMFLAALDQTIVGTSIRTIADDLHGLSLQAWATTSYLITSTITTPIYGKLSDIYGRKPFYLLAISLFVIGSLACTFSASMYQLAAFRALQGLGAGGLMSLAFTIIADIVSPRERAKYQGYFMAVFGVSSVLGPVLGGFLAGQSEILNVTGWRWVFLVNVPIGVIALFVVARVLNVPHERHDHKIDWWGAATLVIGIVPLLIIAEQGREWGWGSERALLCYAVGAIGLIAFVLVEAKMTDAALIPLRLFKNSTFSMVIVAGVILGVGMFGGITMVPQYLQIVKGETPTSAGLMMLPMMLGIMIASAVSGQITSRTGRYKIFPIVGSLFLILGMALFHSIEVDSPVWQPMVYMGVFGLGLGLSMQTLTIAAQNAAPQRDMGVSTASATFFRQLGGTLGVAVFLSVLFSTVGDKIRDAFVRIVPTADFQAAINDPAVRDNPVNAPVFQALQGGGSAGGVLQDSSFLQKVDPRLARPFLEGFTESIQTVFLIGLGVMILAFFVSLFIKEIPLRTGTPPAAMIEGGEALLPDVDEPSGGRHVRPETNGHAEHLVHGQIQNADGSTVGNAVLTLIDNTGQLVSRGQADPTGRYELQVPGTSAYTLVVSASGYRPAAVSLAVPEVGEAHKDVVLNSGGQIGGVARNHRGSPVPEARITVIDEKGVVVSVITTGEDGRYEITDLAEGEYTVIASGYAPTVDHVKLKDGEHATHDVTLGFDEWK